MATSSLSGFGDTEDDFPNDFPQEMTDLDAVLPPVDAAQPAPQDGDDVEALLSQVEFVEENGPMDLLEVRGFFIGTGAGIYEGALRQGEEARDSFYVDVQDYESGEIKRVWGVVLGEVMGQATSQYDLQPGSRIHLLQQGKQELIISAVENGEMKNRRTHANAWICMPDRGPLPSQLAHLMAGINVDQLLDRIALQHDMGLDDERLPGWKQEKKRILRGFGDDPQTIKSWLERQLSLSADDERKLVTTAVELAGYSDADPERRQHEIDLRLAALREMERDARYDYLMETAKPHLVEGNLARMEGLRGEVVDAIEQVAVMATSTEDPESPRRKAMRSALVQSLEGLSLTQQMDYLGQRREQVLQGMAAQLASVQEDPQARVSRNGLIDAKDLSSEEYQMLLEERLALAETKEERAAMLAEEVAARKLEAEAANQEFEAIDRLYQRFSRERDLDAAAYIAGQVVRALAVFVGTRMLPRVATTFEALGGLGSWRKRGCETGLGDLRGALASAKEAPVYQAFVNDPKVKGASAAAGATPGQMLAAHPDFSRTEVVMDHLQAQEGVEAPRPAGGSHDKPVKKGMWSGVCDAMDSLSAKVTNMSPQHVLKSGKIDTQWVDSMRTGLQEFGQDLKETLMPEKLRAQLQEMIASIMAMIQAMIALAKSLMASKAPKAVERAAGAQPQAAGMEP